MTSRQGPADPIAELAHDHGHLGALVQAVGAALARVAEGTASIEEAIDELEDGAESLREGLLAHFAREEEGLFPFIDARVPALRERVGALLAEHDAVVARAAALGAAVREARAAHGHQGCALRHREFVSTYAAHAQAEHALLRDVDLSLGVQERIELRQLLEAI